MEPLGCFPQKDWSWQGAALGQLAQGLSFSLTPSAQGGGVQSPFCTPNRVLARTHERTLKHKSCFPGTYCSAGKTKNCAIKFLKKWSKWVHTKKNVSSEMEGGIHTSQRKRSPRMKWYNLSWAWKDRKNWCSPDNKSDFPDSDIIFYLVLWDILCPSEG